MNFPLHSWEEDRHGTVCVMFYLIAALTAAFSVALFVYAMLM